ncbi:MAG: hypothetical protein MAG451_02814 [Anaerolineales bacterium]|nr:hypothetical protein [Anaerolineales bacterium]
MEAVREKMAEALQAHFAGLRARGEVVPIQEHKRVETVEVSPEDCNRHSRRRRQKRSPPRLTEWQTSMLPEPRLVHV